MGMTGVEWGERGGRVGHMCKTNLSIIGGSETISGISAINGDTFLRARSPVRRKCRQSRERPDRLGKVIAHTNNISKILWSLTILALTTKRATWSTCHENATPVWLHFHVSDARRHFSVVPASHARKPSRNRRRDLYSLSLPISPLSPLSPFGVLFRAVL